MRPGAPRPPQDSLDLLARNSAPQSASAFGELLTAQITPIVQIHSSYSVNTRIIKARDNGGSSSVANNMFKVSTGAGANQSSSLLSRTAVKYNAGQGGLCRFTALFTTGVPNSTQYIGIGTSAEGYFFGYNGAVFGILRRQGGSPEIRTLTVTTKSNTAEDITITLDGDAATDVTVTNGADTTVTASEIAAHDYSNLGTGWSAHAMGANVVFESYPAAVQTGTYSLSGAAEAAGDFAQSVAGVAPTETFIAQEDWSVDKFNGKGPTEIVLDQTKGNVYQIKYQWLGFGLISFFIEDPEDGDYHLVHKIEYANANTIPSIDNPTLPVCLAVKNTSNASDIILQTASMLGAIEGVDAEEGVFNAAVRETTGITTTETPVLSVHNHTVYQSKVNRVEVHMEELGLAFVSSAANKPAIVRLTLNPTLVAAAFAAVDASDSVMRKDVAATSMSGGTVVFAQTLTEGAPLALDLAKKESKLEPGETLTVSLEASNGTIDPDITLDWRELF